MTKTKDDKLKEAAQGIVGLLFLLVVGYFFFGGGPKNKAESSPQVTQLSKQKAATPSSSQAMANKDESKVSNSDYAQNVKIALKKDFNYIDVHLSEEGTLKWLFIVVNFDEWKSHGNENQKQLVELLLRHMKQNFPKNGLKVSIGINEDQPLAEGDWGPLASGPSVEIVGQ